MKLLNYLEILYMFLEQIMLLDEIIMLVFFAWNKKNIETFLTKETNML